MTKFDHNSRINRLERQVNLLAKTIEAAGLTKDFIPLSQAAKILDTNSWVIRDRINKGNGVRLNYHYKMNGNRYQVNVEAWQEIIAADAKAKQN